MVVVLPMSVTCWRFKLAEISISGSELFIVIPVPGDIVTSSSNPFTEMTLFVPFCKFKISLALVAISVAKLADRLEV